MAISVGGARRRHRRQDHPKVAERARPEGQERHGARRRDGPDRHQASARRIEGYIALGVQEGAKLVVDGRGLKVRLRERLLHRRHAVRPRDAAAMRIYRKRSSALVLSVRARARLCDRGAARQRPRVRQRRRRSSPATATPRASSRADRAGRHGHQRADPGADGVLQASAAGSARSSATSRHGEDGVRFYTSSRSLQRWPSTAKGPSS